EQFLREYPVITQGQRNAKYVQQHSDILRVHLMPYFGPMILSDITAGTVQEYRVHRTTSRKHPKTSEPLRPARSTLHHEVVTLRQILKTAHRHGWLQYVPDLSPPYKTS